MKKQNRSQLLTFIKKEFMHVFRDRKTLLMLFGLPIAQIILFGFALSNEIKNSKIIIIDYSNDITTKQLIEKIDASKYFDIDSRIESADGIEAEFKKGIAKMAIIFPPNFADNLQHTGKADIQVITDGSDPNVATAITTYISIIVNDYNAAYNHTSSLPLQINAEMRMMYNPELRGAPTFVPGVMALILMLVCTMMTSAAIVKEKELGTMEILLVSPFDPVSIIISKLTPYLLISILNLLIILFLSVTLLELEIKGNIFLLIFESILFILTSLSIGLLISVNATTQKGAMMTSLMSMMLPTMLLTGFMFPIENMPWPMQVFSNLVPSRWYFITIKNVMLKGLGFSSVWKETLILISMCVLLFSISLRKFKIRLE